MRTVDEVLFHPIPLQKVHIHFCSLGACVIGMDDQFSIGSTDLSFAQFHQWNKYIASVM
jgi:hypothetical protein